MLQNFANQRDSWAQVVSLHGTHTHPLCGFDSLTNRTTKEKESMNSNNNKQEEVEEESIVHLQKVVTKEKQKPKLLPSTYSSVHPVHSPSPTLLKLRGADRGNSSDCSNSTLIGPPLQLFGQTLTESLALSLLFRCQQFHRHDFNCEINYQKPKVLI